MKRPVHYLILILLPLLLSACQNEPEVETKHYKLDAEGIVINVSVTHQDDVLQLYTAETSLPFTEGTREELETIVNQSEARYADYKGVTFTSEIMDHVIVTTQSLNFSEMDAEELVNDPTFADFASGSVTFSELENAFKTQGFKEIESE